MRARGFPHNVVEEYLGPENIDDIKVGCLHDRVLLTLRATEIEGFVRSVVDA